jgi:hypothetical protein
MHVMNNLHRLTRDADQIVNGVFHLLRGKINLRILVYSI